MEYKVVISPKMRAVENLLLAAFVGMNHCISKSGENLIVEVPRGMCDAVRAELKKEYRDVALMKNAYPLIEDLHDFILIKPIISESPVHFSDGVHIPELEKWLVDHAADKEYASQTDADIQKAFQRSFELYPVNLSRLYRYAGRKGEKAEIQGRVERIDQRRVAIVHTIREYFQQEPIEKAWLFGSFSRMEEKPDSDIDILVDLDKTESIGLLKFAGMINELESRLGKKVDLVERGAIKPFAIESINRDKILIYERART